MAHVPLSLLYAGKQPSSRGCKYALNVLLQGIAVPEVSMALPQVGCVATA